MFCLISDSPLEWWRSQQRGACNAHLSPTGAKGQTQHCQSPHNVITAIPPDARLACSIQAQRSYVLVSAQITLRDDITFLKSDPQSVILRLSAQTNTSVESTALELAGPAEMLLLTCSWIAFDWRRIYLACNHPQGLLVTTKQCY